MRIKNNGKKNVMYGVDNFIKPGKTEDVPTEEGKRICKLFDFCQDEKDVKESEDKAKAAEDEAFKALEELEKVKAELAKVLKENTELKKDIETYQLEISELVKKPLVNSTGTANKK